MSTLFLCVYCLMIPRPPRSTRSVTLFPDPTLFRSPALLRKANPLQFTSDSRGIAAEFQACVVIKGQGLHRNRAPAGLVSNVETRDFHWRNCGLDSSAGERRSQDTSPFFGTHYSISLCLATLLPHLLSQNPYKT